MRERTSRRKCDKESKKTDTERHHILFQMNFSLQLHPSPFKGYLHIELCEYRSTTQSHAAQTNTRSERRQHKEEEKMRRVLHRYVEFLP